MAEPVQAPSGDGTHGTRDAVRHLVTAARTGGLSHILGSLRQTFDTEVALFDRGGSVISAAPLRTLWDFDAVMRVRRGEDDGHETMLVRPIDIDGESIALLVVRADEDPESILAVAVDLIILEINRLQAQQQGRLGLLAALLEDVFSKRVSDNAGDLRLAAFGIDPQRQHRVIVAWDRSGTQTTSAISGHSLYSLVTQQPDPNYSVKIGEHIVMVVPDDPMVWRLAETLHANLVRGATQGDENSIHVGVGRPHQSSAGLRASYYEALTAVQEGPGVREPMRADLARLFVMTNTNHSLREVAHTILEDLIEYDATQGADLVQTLRVFLKNNQSVQATTDELFIHRNTLRYRRAQIERLLDRDLDESATITNLWLALEILDEDPGTVHDS